MAGLEADVGDAQAEVVAEILVDGEVGLERVGVVPVGVDGGVEGAGAVGGEPGGRGGGADVGEGEERVAGGADVIEALEIGLQGAGERVEDGAGGGDVVENRRRRG